MVSPSGRTVRRKTPEPAAVRPAEQLDPIDRFLVTLARTGNPSVACHASTMTRRQINSMRQKDAAFEVAFQDALDEAADMLEAEAWRRALEGVEQPVVKSGKAVVDPATGETITVRRYSDVLLMLLLRGSKPGKFASRQAAAGRDDRVQVIKEIATDDDPPRRGTRPEQ